MTRGCFLNGRWCDVRDSPTRNWVRTAGKFPFSICNRAFIDCVILGKNVDIKFYPQIIKSQKMTC